MLSWLMGDGCFPVACHSKSNTFDCLLVLNWNILTTTFMIKSSRSINAFTTTQFVQVSSCTTWDGIDATIYRSWSPRWENFTFEVNPQLIAGCVSHALQLIIRHFLPHAWHMTTHAKFIGYAFNGILLFMSDRRETRIKHDKVEI